MLMMISCLTMLIDHIGILLGCTFMRVIGRLAMPIYAYFIAVGVEKTSNLKKYLLRLLVASVAAQMPYMFAIGKHDGNVCITWLIAALVLIVLKKNTTVFSKMIPVAGLLSLSCIIPMDYGIYGVLVVLLFQYRNRKKNTYRSILLFTALFLSGFLFQDAIQCFAALAVPIIVVCEKTGTERVQSPVVKIVYRWFYPAHLSVLVVFKYIFA